MLRPSVAATNSASEIWRRQGGVGQIAGPGLGTATTGVPAAVRPRIMHQQAAPPLRPHLPIAVHVGGLDEPQRLLLRSRCSMAASTGCQQAQRGGG